MPAVAAVSSAPQPPVPTTRVPVFNNPVVRYDVRPEQRGGSAQVRAPGAPSRITGAIVAALTSASAGATVSIAMFNASDDTLSKGGVDTRLIQTALRAASHRVRAIDVLVDSGHDRSLWRSLGRLPHLSVRACDGACFHRGSGIMHNKFLLVDNTTWTPGIEHVVLQLTANLTDAQLSNRNWNSGLQIAGDRALYDGYRHYFDQLWACAPGCVGAPNPQDFSGSPGSGMSVNLFPRVDGADPVLDELDALTDCSRDSEVDIAVNDWRMGGRGLEILDRLEQLQADGCRVRVIVQANEHAGIARVLPDSSLADAAHCTSHGRAAVDRMRLSPRVHSKYVLLRGTFRGVAHSTVVSTGSERFSGTSRVHDDETWLTLWAHPGHNPVNAAVYATYAANFDEMWSSTPVCAPPPPS